MCSCPSCDRISQMLVSMIYFYKELNIDGYGIKIHHFNLVFFDSEMALHSVI